MLLACQIAQVASSPFSAPLTRNPSTCMRSTIESTTKPM
jgi:hypothetical protein